MSTYIKSVVAIGILLCLTACATTQEASQKVENAITKSHVKKTTKQNYQPTQAKNIKIESKQLNRKEYASIGTVYVSRYNVWGIKRQLGVITDLMQAQAARVGGNAIIDIKMDHKYAKGEIVKFKKIT